MKSVLFILIAIVLVTSAFAIEFERGRETLNNPRLQVTPPSDTVATTDAVVKAPSAACVDGAAPTDNCDIFGSISFPTGTYSLPNGMNVLADNIVIDCNGATLVGNDQTFGMDIGGRRNVEITDCNLESYITGIRLLDSMNITVTNSGFTNFDGVSSSAIGIANSCNVDVTGSSFSNMEESRPLWIMLWEPPNVIDPSTCDRTVNFYQNTVNTAKRIAYIQGNNATNYPDLPMYIERNTGNDITYAINMQNSNNWLYFRHNTLTQSGGPFMQDGTFNVDVSFNNISSTNYGQIGTAVYDGIPHYQFAENISIHDNNYDMQYAVFFMETNVGHVEFYQNTVANAMRGIHAVDVTGLHMHSNTITNNEIGIQITPVSDQNTFYLNNIYGNTAVNIDTVSGVAAVPWEMGLGGKGNYWGHSSAPCFDVDSDAWQGAGSMLTDPYAQCSPNSGKDITIHLSQQYSWYFFSYNVQPANSNPDVIFQAVSSVVQFAKSFINSNPLVWFVDDPFGSTLTSMNYKHGYWMKTTDPASALVITGTSADACQTLSLNSGIHWVSYYGQEEKPVEEALQSITGKYEWVRTFVNEQPQTYDPLFPTLSDLQTLKPGQAYRIKMTSPGTLHYC